jgi:DNA-directed RNA polymerase sigma subunit (sigma70/sigma32)
MQHTRRTVITAPVPTVEEVAKRLGVPRRRVRQLERLIDSFIEGDTRRRHAARRVKVKAKRRR